MRLTAGGWAIVDSLGINVRTVSLSVRATMVIWLCVSKGIPLSDIATTSDIEMMWQRHRGDAQVKPVLIAVSDLSDPLPKENI